MINIQNQKKKITNYLLMSNIIFAIIFFFYINKTIAIISILYNIFFLITYIIVDKYDYIFEGIKQTNKIARKLNDKLGEIN